MSWKYPKSSNTLQMFLSGYGILLFLITMYCDLLNISFIGHLFVDFFFGINNAAVNILTHESWTASYSIYSKLLLQRVFKLIHTLNKALLFWKAFPIPPSIWWLKNSSSLIFFFFPITSEVQLFNVYKCSFLIFVN